MTTAPPHGSSGTLLSSLHAILTTQRRTLALFLSHPPTRTPVLVLCVASFGGALHHAVTTYFYLAVGANEVDIGQLGFIMSVGALMGSPASGAALDKYGPWIPISVTAGACAGGCWWRGVASGVPSLRMGAILLGIGVNLWTVVLGHLVKSFPVRMRSEVLSGFAVQTTLVQLAGKGTFPLVEYALHRVVGMEDALARYRIHMGVCTFFCFYGTFALVWDRRNVQQQQPQPQAPMDGRGAGRGGMAKYRHKHSDVVDELEEEMMISDAADEGEPTAHGIELTSASSANADSVRSLSMSERDSDDSLAESPSAFLNEPEPLEVEDTKKQVTTEAAGDSNNPRTSLHQHLGTTVILTLALLLQSVSTTVLTVLWPLLAHDRFDLSAHTFGMLTFASSAVSTGAVAAFPVVERWENIGGRVRCAAWGFGLGAILCGVFCVCSFGEYDAAGAEMGLGGAAAGDADGDAAGRSPIDDGGGGASPRWNGRRPFLFHALSAVALQAVLCFLEPSLKSILSIVVHAPSAAPSSSSSKSSLGGVVGFLQTLGSIGGMIGNLAGTWMYKLSKDMAATDGTAPRALQGGSLPFVAVSVFMALVSFLIFCLEEPAHFDAIDGGYTAAHGEDVESGRGSSDGEDCVDAESVEDAENGTPEGCCLALRETTYDLKLD